MLPIPPQVLIQIGAKVLPQLIGAGMSYSQAAKQKKEMKSAEDEAAKAIAAARAKLAETPLERVQVPTEAYQNAMQQITAQSMQATQATQEAGARELAASVGRIGAMGLTATEQQRESMAQDIYKRDMAVAEDEGRRLEKLSMLDTMEAMGAERAASQADERRGAALTSATTGLGSALSTGIGLLPLFANSGKIAGMSAAEGAISKISSPEIFASEGKMQPTSLLSQRENTLSESDREKLKEQFQKMVETYLPEDSLNRLKRNRNIEGLAAMQGLGGVGAQVLTPEQMFMYSQLFR
jgi:hypothetical protein